MWGGNGCLMGHMDLQQEVRASQAAEKRDPGRGAEVQAVLEIHQRPHARAALHVPNHGLRAAPPIQDKVKSTRQGDIYVLQFES
jgi:hypothetical protein